jgi:hypothetical protein
VQVFSDRCRGDGRHFRFGHRRPGDVVSPLGELPHAVCVPLPPVLRADALPLELLCDAVPSLVPLLPLVSLPAVPLPHLLPADVPLPHLLPAVVPLPHLLPPDVLPLVLSLEDLLPPDVLLPRGELLPADHLLPLDLPGDQLADDDLPVVDVGNASLLPVKCRRRTIGKPRGPRTS